MNRLNEHEKGLEDFVSAMNTTLPKDVRSAINNKIKELKPTIDQDFFRTNRVLTGTYFILLDETQLGHKLGKIQFNILQKKWVDNAIKGHEQKIFSESLIETLGNYNSFISDSEISVEPNGQDINIEMKDGCMYKAFCEYTSRMLPGKEKCIRGTAIKHIVNYFQPEPYQFILEKQNDLSSCTIRVISNLCACDIINEYRRNNKSFILL